MTEQRKPRKRKIRLTETEGSSLNSKESKGINMDAISQELAKLDSRRQDLARKLDDAQKSSDYETFQKIGNSYLGTILESINLYIDLIREISSDPVAGELKTEFADIVKKGSNTKGLEGQSEWISNDVSPLYEKVRQICACVYAAVAKIDQEANRIS
jgi:tetrahydromethanopterin S-methyltransferase subunit B